MTNPDVPRPPVHPAVTAAVDAARAGDLLGLHSLVDWRLSNAGRMVAAAAGIPSAMVGRIPDLLDSGLRELDESMRPTRDNRHFLVRPLAAVLAKASSVRPASPDERAALFGALRLPERLPEGPTAEQLERLVELRYRAAVVDEVYVAESVLGDLPVGVTPGGLLVVPTLEGDEAAALEYLYTVAAPSGFDLETGLPRDLADPGRLLDAGEWFSAAEELFLEAEQAAEPQASEALARSVAALDEVLKLVPEGAARVPDEAFWTDGGRRVRDADPARFTVDALLEMRAALTGPGRTESGY
jgi:hypothetical protein